MHVEPVEHPHISYPAPPIEECGAALDPSDKVVKSDIGWGDLVVAHDHFHEGGMIE